MMTIFAVGGAASIGRMINHPVYGLLGELRKHYPLATKGLTDEELIGRLLGAAFKKIVNQCPDLTLFAPVGIFGAIVSFAVLFGGG